MFDISLVNSVYDDLSSKVKTDLDEQFNRGRIKGTDYANVYSQLMNQILQLAFQTPLQSAQIDNINKDLETKDAQEKLIEAQTQNQLEDIKVKQEQEKLINAQTEDQLESINLKKKQEDLTDAQTKVAIRQEQSYNDSIRLKLFKTQMDNWAVMFGSGLLDKKPSIINNDEASSLYTDIKNRIR